MNECIQKHRINTTNCAVSPQQIATKSSTICPLHMYRPAQFHVNCKMSWAKNQSDSLSWTVCPRTAGNEPHSGRVSINKMWKRFAITTMLSTGWRLKRMQHSRN